jgi:hypothetical protein
MKGFAAFIVAASVAFAAFSGYYGSEYDDARGLYFTDRRPAAVSEMSDIHTTVKAVSLPYFLVALSFFSRAYKAFGRRGASAAGMLGSLAMTGWTLIVGPAASFDEVYPAWIAAAVVIGGLAAAVAKAPARAAAVDAGVRLDKTA